MYTLYGFPFSQHSRRVVSLLEQAGLAYRFELVDLRQGAHLAPDYLALNPNHQVPTLVGDNLVLFESNAILRFLCNRHGLQQWYPPAAEARAAVDQWLDWIQCRMSPAVVDVVLNGVFLGDKGDRAAAQRGRERVVELGALLDRALAKRRYLVGDAPTIADLALVSNVFQLGLAEAVPGGDNIGAWYAAMLALPGVQKSLPAM